MKMKHQNHHGCQRDVTWRRSVSLTPGRRATAGLRLLSFFAYLRIFTEIHEESEGVWTSCWATQHQNNRTDWQELLQRQRSPASSWRKSLRCSFDFKLKSKMLSPQSCQFLPDHAIEHQFVFQGYLKVVMFVSLQQTVLSAGGTRTRWLNIRWDETSQSNNCDDETNCDHNVNIMWVLKCFGISCKQICLQKAFMMCVYYRAIIYNVTTHLMHL